MEKILFVSPHSDDIEFGCGGTISKLLAKKKEVHVAVLSFCEQSVPKGFPKNVLKKEFADSMNVFGVEKVHKFDFTVRKFPEERQEILEEFYSLRRKHGFDTVFVPSVSDIHQDHHVSAIEAMRAFKDSSILCYELPWNALDFKPNFFIELSKKDLDSKINACSCYKSQSFRKYSNPELVKSIAIVRGVQCGKDFAEAFEARKFIY